MNRNRLSTFQLLSLGLTSSMLGLFVTTPAGFSPWYFLSVIAIFLLQSLSLLLLNFSFSRSGFNSADTLVRQCFSPLPGRIFMVLFSILLLARSALTLSFQTDCIALYLLEDTPDLAIMIVLLTTSFFALLPGLKKLSGVSTLLVLILTGTITLIVISGLAGADIGELRTLVQPVSGEFIPSLIPAAVTAAGAECAIFFFHPNPKRKSFSGFAVAPVACAVIFTALVCAAAGTIGLDGMRTESFPLVEGARRINLGGIELTERFDLPLITVGLLASLVQMAIYTLCAAHALCTAIGSTKTGTAALALLPAQLVLTLVIQYTSFDGIISAVCAAGLTAFSLIIFPLMSLFFLIGHKEVSSA